MSGTIGANQVVGIHYTLRGEDKEVLDSSEGQEPLLYLHGHNQIVVGLEKALAGRKVGDKIDVTVTAGKKKVEQLSDEELFKLIEETSDEVGLLEHDHDQSDNG